MFTSRFGSDALLWPRTTVTRLGVAVPGRKLRFDASGRPVPFGETVKRLDGVPPASVTFNTAAVAVAGMGSVPLGSPLTPVICTVRVTPAPSAPGAHSTHEVERVSRIRKGGMGT